MFNTHFHNNKKSRVKRIERTRAVHIGKKLQTPTIYLIWKYESQLSNNGTEQNADRPIGTNVGYVS
jgi:hypothetical protein